MIEERQAAGMEASFFEKPILNSPYGFPLRHWELDASGQPTNRIIQRRRHWPPGVNNLGKFGRWDFAEMTALYEIESDFAAKVKEHFEEMIETALSRKTGNHSGNGNKIVSRPAAAGGGR